MNKPSDHTQRRNAQHPAGHGVMIAECQEYPAADARQKAQESCRKTQIGVQHFQALRGMAMSLFPLGHLQNLVAASRQDSVVGLQMAWMRKWTAEHLRDGRKPGYCLSGFARISQERLE